MHRVLHVGPVPPPLDGGIAAYLDGILRSGLAQQYEVQTFDVRVPDLAKRHRLLRAGTSVRLLRDLARTLRRCSPDLVHIHSSAYLSFWEKCAMGRLVARQRIPWVLHLHDGFFETFLPNLREPLASLARSNLRSAAAIISPCRSWRSWLSDWVAENRLHVLANGIDFDAHEPAPTPASQNVHLLFMGNLTIAKGIDDLAQSLGSLYRAGAPPFQLELLGRPDPSDTMPRIRRIFREAGIEDRVHFSGMLYGDDKQRAFQRADIFLLPSHKESFCIANLEAMASGLPVISTVTGAIPEVIRDGHEGLLVPPRDPQALAQAIETLLLNREKRHVMGVAARERARDYDWPIISNDLAQIYEGVLQQTLTRPAHLPSQAILGSA